MGVQRPGGRSADVDTAGDVPGGDVSSRSVAGRPRAAEQTSPRGRRRSIVVDDDEDAEPVERRPDPGRAGGVGEGHEAPLAPERGQPPGAPHTGAVPDTEGRIVAVAAAGPDLVPERHGAKACGLQRLLRLGLPVPPAFVVPVDVAAELAASAASGLVAEVRDELDAAVAALAAGDPAARVSVRSGAAISLPGVFATELGVPATPASVLSAVAAVEASTRGEQVEAIVAAMGLTEVPPSAVVVQRMVDGTVDDRSGAGVAVGRDPISGGPGPTGSIAWRSTGDSVMQGAVPVEPLGTLADRLPDVADQLAAGLARLERALGRPAEVEFTVSAGVLWYLQLRTPDLPPPSEALPPEGTIVARGRAASPGVGTGALHVDVDDALDAIEAGTPVVIALETSSPGDIPVMVGAAAVITVLGSPESHAAVVTRGAGVPAVVSVQGLHLEPDGVRVGGRRIPVGAALRVDGSRGAVLVPDR